jgi:ribosomal protein S21
MQAKSSGGGNKDSTEVEVLMSEVRDESLMNIDTERRKREIQTALRRAQKGLRYV